jgi:hypothetical protein
VRTSFENQRSFPTSYQYCVECGPRRRATRVDDPFLLFTGDPSSVYTSLLVSITRRGAGDTKNSLGYLLGRYVVHVLSPRVCNSTTIKVTHLSIPTLVNSFLFMVSPPSNKNLLAYAQCPVLEFDAYLLPHTRLHSLASHHHHLSRWLNSLVLGRPLIHHLTLSCPLYAGHHGFTPSFWCAQRPATLSSTHANDEALALS